MIVTKPTENVNPFTPTFGKTPLVLAGREEILEDMAEGFENGSGDPNLSAAFIGSRGIGKTALMSCICDEALGYGWISASVSAAPGMLDDLLIQARRAAESYIARNSRTRLSSVELGPISASWEHVEEQGNWRSKMTDLLDELGKYDIGLLITVDEVTAELDEMIQLAATYQHFIRENRKVALVFAGLPFNVSSLLRDKTVSFLRRARQHQLGLLSDENVRDAFAETFDSTAVSIEDAALDRCVEAAGGFPYMIQLIGYYTWRLARGNGHVTVADADKGIKRAARELKANVLDATCSELSPVDMEFLMAMTPDADASALADIAERMGVKSNYASKYKARLLAAGVIETKRRGLYTFALPGLREYLLEQDE